MVIHFKSAFENLSEKDVDEFMKLNKNKLIGSSIFTSNNSIISKIVRFVEKKKLNRGGFIPSHTGSIIEYNNNIYVFDMKPLRASITLLKNYLLNTKDDFCIVIRDYDLDGKMFSANVAYHIGEFYPFLSAISSVFSKRNTKYRTHCSELHLRELQKQGLFLDINAEITPLELLDVLTNK